MINYVRVAPDEVLAAKVQLELEKQLGVESDPLLVRLANAVECIPADNRLEEKVMSESKLHRPINKKLLQPTLRPYDPDSKCPKCDGSQVDATWRPSNVRLSSALGLAKTGAAEREPGWMHRTCLNCDYEWGESTLDEPNDE